MGNALLLFLKMNGLEKKHNAYRVGVAWNEVSGAASHTTGFFYRDGILTVTVNSSMARTHLEMQKDGLLARINETLGKDELFIKDGYKGRFVTELKLK